MNKIQLLDMLKNQAKDYRKGANESLKRNSHMNHATGKLIDQNDIDAILVDFINFVGIKQGMDYALYTASLTL